MTSATATREAPDQPVLWQVRFEASAALIDAAAPLFDTALSQARMCAGDGSNCWRFEALFDIQPDAAGLEAGLAVAAAALGQPAPAVVVEGLEHRDWLADNQAALKAMEVGRFRIVPAHLAGSTPLSPCRSIVLDAGPAFGSGAHETTRSCLELVERVARRGRPRRIVDLGTGSGILAIGAARLWSRRVVATDADPVAVATAMANARANGCATLVDGRIGAGTGPVRRGERFDLVVANILAGPLAAMARDIRQIVAPGGRLILSGILSKQENLVLTRYLNAGFRLTCRETKPPWSSYLLRRVR